MTNAIQILQKEFSSSPARIEVLKAHGISDKGWLAVAGAYLGNNKNIIDACQNDIDRSKLLNSMVICAQAGVMIDGKEAYIDAWRSKKNNALSLTTIIMAQGLKKIVARGGYEIDAFPIRQNQEPILKVIDGREILETKPINAFDTSPIIGWVATAHDKNTGQLVKQKLVSLNEIEKRKKISKAHNKFLTGEAKVSIWNDWGDEMAKKTCLRIIAKDLSGIDRDSIMDDDLHDDNSIGKPVDSFDKIPPPVVKTQESVVDIIPDISAPPAPEPMAEKTDREMAREYLDKFEACKTRDEYRAVNNDEYRDFCKKLLKGDDGQKNIHKYLIKSVNEIYDQLPDDSEPALPDYMDDNGEGLKY